MMDRNQRKRTIPADCGILLVVMVGLLTLLLITAVFFTALTRVERVRTSSDTDGVRAKLLARSGLEYALARLVEQTEPGILETVVGTPSEDDWRYRDDPEISLEHSRNPSYNADPFTDTDADRRFSDGDPYVDPDHNQRYDGWSGRLRGSYASYGDRFKLRIEDPTGKISINGNGSSNQPEPLLVDHNGNGVWDREEPFVDRPTRIEDPDPPQEQAVQWKSYYRGAPDGFEWVTGRIEPPNEVWDAGDKVLDQNGNGKRDFFKYQDRNRNGAYDPPSDDYSDDPTTDFAANYANEHDPTSDFITGDYSDWWYLGRGDHAEERRPNGSEEENATYTVRLVKEDYLDTIRNGIWDPPEPFTDLDGNGRWTPADEYVDINGNGRWDDGRQQAGLDRMLNTLGETFEIEKLGEKITEIRPVRDWSEVAEVIEKNAFVRIAPYVTLWGKANETTFRPVPPLPVGGGVQGSEYMISQLDLNGIGRPASEPRVPVNVNEASQPVLVSLFSGISARWLSRGCLESFAHADIEHHIIGEMRNTNPVTREQAERLALQIFRYRTINPGKPFHSFREFDRFLVDQNIPAQVRANCNPNARLNKFTPNALWDRPVDKLDLTAYTTEVTFSPSGLFEISSFGELYDSFFFRLEEGWEVKASRRIDTVFSFWREWHETTQADFVRGTISANSEPIMAPSYRDRSLQIYPEPELSHLGPSDIEGFIVLATNRSERIPGDETAEEIQMGVTIETDPALTFYTRYENGLNADYSRGDPTCYLETDSDPSANPEWHGTQFPPDLYDEPSFRPNENPILGYEGGSSDKRRGPGSLYPDGVFSDRRNLPYYSMDGHFQTRLTGVETEKVYEPDGSWKGKRLQVPAFSSDGTDPDGNKWHEGEYGQDEGAITFWVKPGFVRGNANNVPHRFFSATYAPWYFYQWSWRFQVGGGLYTGASTTAIWGFFMEPDDDMTEGGEVDNEAVGIEEMSAGERGVKVQDSSFIMTRGTWKHFTVGWDQDENEAGRNYQAYWDDERINNGSMSYNQAVRPYVWMRLFREDDGSNRRRFRLGESNRWKVTDPFRPHVPFGNSPACSTIDELCLYEQQKTFDEDGETDFAAERYLHGRYYNRGDAIFTSRPRIFESGTKFLEMRWTMLLPSGEWEQSDTDAMLQEAKIRFGVEEEEPEGNEPKWRILLDFFDGRKWLLDLDGDGELSREEERRARILGLADEGGVPFRLSEQQERLDQAFYENHPESATPPDGFIRYRAYFKEDADWLSTPLLETPMLDDVTITYIPAGGPSLFLYKE